MNRAIAIAIVLFPAFVDAQITIQKNSTLFLSKNTELFIQDDIISSDSIAGEGTVILQGNRSQLVDFGNYTASRVRIKNPANVQLASDLSISRSLVLEDGHLLCGSYTLSLMHDAVASGNSNSFIQTNAHGKIEKLLNKNVVGYVLPVGYGDIYTPVSVKSVGSYSNAVLTVQSNGTPNPNKPSSAVGYLSHYWKLRSKGISGDVSIIALLGKKNADISELQPYLWNGKSWKKRGRIDLENNRLVAEIPDGEVELYAMTMHDNSIRVAPNPVENIASIAFENETDESAILKIVTSTGKIVITQQLNLRNGHNRVNIDVSPLPGAPYTLTISTNSTQRSTQLIKR